LGFYTRIIACAETVAETFVPNGAAYAQRIEVVANGQKPPKRFSRSDARRKFGLPPDATVIGQIGRFSPQKNQAFSLGLLHALPRTTLLFVGSGPDQTDVKTMVEAKGLVGRVHFVDAIDYARIGIFFAAVDAVLFPSRFEGLSLAAIEAIHCDVPPICSDIPSFREMFRTSSYLTEKLLAPLDDRNAWLERIHAVLPGGAERQRVLAELAKLSPAYTFDTMAKRYLAVLD
jgi:glycosyltransferase involved in cell wall biosynthesis